MTPPTGPPPGVPPYARGHRSAPRPNRLSQALDDARRQKRSILDLTVSNPAQAGIRLPLDLLRDCWRKGLEQPYRPDPQGLPEARQAISAYYRSLGQRVDARDILLTSSTSEAYSLCFKLFADPNQEVLVPSPSYPLLEDLCRLEGLRSRRYDLERIDDAWRFPRPLPGTPFSRVLVTVNPNNPTGSLLGEEDWQSVAEFAGLQAVVVLSDEVFSDYRFPDWNPSPPPVSELPLIRLNGISKIAGLPQLKLAWLAVEGPETFRRSTLQRLEWISDTYLSVGTPIQWTLPRILAEKDRFQQPIRRRISRNREHAVRKLSRQPVQLLPPQAGWNALLRLPRFHSDEEWALRLLDRADLLVHPGYLFGFQEEGFIVVSLLTPEEEFRTGLQRLLQLITSEG